MIAGRTLAAILTAEKYSDRLLGGNKMISVTNRFTQVALGNNVEVWGDMKRRVVPVRLVPDVEHPEDRTDFRHPNLEEWVRAHRGELLAALLTIWRNWIAKGRPEASTGMGSFDRWSRAVGGALQAAGIDGFRSNTAGWLSDSDDDDGWGDHLRQLLDRFGGGEWFTVAEVVRPVEAMSLDRPPVKRDPDKTLAQLIGYAYRKNREKWHGDLRLVGSESRDSASGGRTWSVIERHSQTPKPSSASSGWSGATDDTDHPDDRNLVPERERACGPKAATARRPTHATVSVAGHHRDYRDPRRKAGFPQWHLPRLADPEPCRRNAPRRSSSTPALVLHRHRPLAHHRPRRNQVEPWFREHIWPHVDRALQAKRGSWGTLPCGHTFSSAGPLERDVVPGLLAAWIDAEFTWGIAADDQWPDFAPHKVIPGPLGEYG